mgnify:CR=1 FL=1|jgi:hypothetical protein
MTMLIANARTWSCRPSDFFPGLSQTTAYDLDSACTIIVQRLSDGEKLDLPDAPQKGNVPDFL